MSLPQADLPPRPGSFTGEPRPPAAPEVMGGARGTLQESTGDRPTPPSKFILMYTPPKPSKAGPTLEWSHLAWHAVGPAFFRMCVVFLLAAPFGMELREETLIPALLLLAGCAALLAYSTAWETKRLSAGADWFRNGSAVVSLYSLTQVEVSRSWDPRYRIFRGVWCLNLKDQRHGRVTTRLASLQAHPRLWDLVYSGIVHSAADGATIDEKTRQRLRLNPAGG